VIQPPTFSGAVQEISIDELVTFTMLTFAGRSGAEIKTLMLNLVSSTMKDWKTK
jgi:hypothetical protein